MPEAIQVVLGVMGAYVLGSVPTGLWLGQRLRGIDIRQHGSGNIGATNTMRVLGKRLGSVALACDMAKGLLPVVVISAVSSWPYAPILCGAAAVAGHTASIFLQFRGGKGVATSTGVFLGLCPVPTILAAAVFALVTALTRMVSAGSISAAIAFCVIVWALPNPWPIRVLATAMALLIILRHRANIRRILTGTENRI
ncbi:MAG TPA: glycerol-3-phosphate 1-O-acyltransferase PlsY [Candidatus Hydrogenedentes bacterium]|nr:glycerol-3-phosphate 1-O-acyltransferase PlsY [Candidatus Hydrogenedentota bacterium]HPG66674.1 glycerol-3-phosphate 1-O-acyltransferase PlsY [Candidatus Hydrogenedentota bacterium]